MSNVRGLSLIEVLISLCLFSLSALSLFKHQWQLTKSMQHQSQQALAQHLLNDATDVLLSQFKLPYKLQQQAKTQLNGALTHQLKGGEPVRIYIDFIQQGSKNRSHIERKFM
jgi:Tfp pilus assembly protein PilV